MKYFYNPNDRKDLIINYSKNRLRYGICKERLLRAVLEFVLPYDFKYWLLKPIASKHAWWYDYGDFLREKGYTFHQPPHFIDQEYYVIGKQIDTVSFKLHCYKDKIFVYIDNYDSLYRWWTKSKSSYNQPVYTKPTLLLLLKEFEKYVMKVQPLIELGNLEGLRDQKLKDLENKIKILKESES